MYIIDLSRYLTPECNSLQPVCKYDISLKTVCNILILEMFVRNQSFAQNYRFLSKYLYWVILKAFIYNIFAYIIYNICDLWKWLHVGGY